MDPIKAAILISIGIASIPFIVLPLMAGGFEKAKRDQLARELRQMRRARDSARADGDTLSAGFHNFRAKTARLIGPQ